MLSPDLEFVSMHSNDDCIIFQVQSKIKDPICPYCETPSQKCHLKYKKSFNNLPVHGKNVVIEIINRKIFCNNLVLCQEKVPDYTNMKQVTI